MNKQRGMVIKQWISTEWDSPILETQDCIEPRTLTVLFSDLLQVEKDVENDTVSQKQLLAILK